MIRSFYNQVGEEKKSLIFFRQDLYALDLPLPSRVQVLNSAIAFDDVVLTPTAYTDSFT